MTKKKKHKFKTLEIFRMEKYRCDLLGIDVPKKRDGGELILETDEQVKKKYTVIRINKTAYSDDMPLVSVIFDKPVTKKIPVENCVDIFDIRDLKHLRALEKEYDSKAIGFRCAGYVKDEAYKASCTHCRYLKTK